MKLSGTKKRSNLILILLLAHAVTPKKVSKRSTENDLEVNTKDSDGDGSDESDQEGSTTTDVGEEEPMFSVTGYPEAGDVPILNRKIFRARRVTIQEHPYVVSIRRNYSHFLTGALIRTNLVISIAHPLNRVPVHELGVVPGQSYNDRGTAILTVIFVFIHRLFNPYTLANDIALLYFYETIFLNKPYKANTKLIPITKFLKLNEGDKAHVTGWGRCDMTGKELCLPRSSVFFPNEVMDPMLRSIMVDIGRTNLYCKGYENLGLKLLNTMLCAGQAREADSTAPCLAVPGAPLVLRGKLLGVASWGFGCGFLHDLPLIYTDVRKYVIWIRLIEKKLRALCILEMKKLYEATKAYKEYGILSQTRVKVKNRTRRGDILNSLEADWILSAVWPFAKIYDVRNFVDSGKYHGRKKSMYEQIRNELALLVAGKLSNIDFNDTRVEHAEL